MTLMDVTEEADARRLLLGQVRALERIATALEQIALEVVNYVSPGGMPPLGFLTGEPPLPTPPPEVLAAQAALFAQYNSRQANGVTVPLPPVEPVQGPALAPAFRWAAGMNHVAGHKPLKENNRGLYCPTKLPDGTWCQFAVKAG